MIRYIAKWQTRVLSAFDSREQGATAVEYGLMVALIAVVVALGATTLGVNVSGLFNKVAGQV